MSKYPENNIKVPRFNEANGFYTTRERSYLMSKIKSQNTKTEHKLRKFLWNVGVRYRKNVKKLPGKPDIVISKYKLIIFIDGEFWHGYNWKEKRDKIMSNREFWIPKIERNIARDLSNNKYYTERGWTVMRFWEQEIKNEFHVCINQIISFLDDN
jgi:DNA mismatch endonuclease, patch repair protein